MAMDIESIAEEAEEYLEIERKIREMEELLEKKRSLEEKLREKEKAVLEEIKERFNLTKEEVERAAELKINADDLSLTATVIEMINREGAEVINNKEFKEYAQTLKIVKQFEQIPHELLKSIISIESVKTYIIRKEEAEKQKEIERTKQSMRTGRLGERTAYALKYIMKEEPTDREYMKHMKAKFNISTAEANRVRWYLLNKKYIERSEGRLTITKLGIARLSDE
ncbi:MAG: hypothetical protein QIT35_gp63 [Methanophagales virus PBV299]|uniref:Uncharacterized protein n=1 Tax=Methanophagales virus PBV299 TaxID=2987730 RepID=A0ABY6GLV8_9CAUD|nr:MAG: hypothetical protein QIT35_gp63 [Methanophagales virus PBV299]UYL64859.1 MAG: hypothetical protein OFDIEDLO_00063 [Methanophagales virus PBV299]